MPVELGYVYDERSAGELLIYYTCKKVHNPPVLHTRVYILITGAFNAHPCHCPREFIRDVQ